MNELTDDQVLEICYLWDMGKKISAVHMLRELTGINDITLCNAFIQNLYNRHFA